MIRRGGEKRRLTAAGVLWWLARRWWLVALLAALFVTGGLIRSCKRGGTSVGLTHTTAIDATPEEITALKDIGQWELLTISTEELIDTVATSWTGVRQLVRIYTGTLRIGIDLRDATPGWATARGDTAWLRLPPVKLLDERFIDEARTRSFYERGRWDATTRQQLYERAREAMMRRCLTQENMDAARQNARQQFTSLLRGLGYTHINITFENT